MIVRILFAQLHIARHDMAGQRFHSLELAVLREVIEVKCVLGADAIGVAEKLIAKAIE